MDICCPRWDVLSNCSFTQTYVWDHTLTLQSKQMQYVYTLLFCFYIYGSSALVANTDSKQHRQVHCQQKKTE